MPSNPTFSNWISLITLGLIWGASFLGIAIALDGFAPLWVAAGRIAIGALTLTGVALILGIRLPSQREVWVFAATS